jgi:hypothetical protein
MYLLLLTFSKTAAKLFIFDGKAKENTQKMHICHRILANSCKYALLLQ